MANLSKKWGTVIGCWCVALVLIVTGICLGLVIPSSAAEENYEGDIAVMFDANGDGVIGEDETTIYHNLDAAFDAAEASAATKGKPVTIKLLSNVSTNTQTSSRYGAQTSTKNTIFDLNGYVWQSDNFSIYACNTFNIIDSRPDTLHYCAYSEVEKSYSFTSQELIGHKQSEVYGGIIATNGNGELFAMKADDGQTVGEITIDGGTLLGTTGRFNIMESCKIVVNKGNLQLYTNLPDNTPVAIISWGNGLLEINGGNIYGQVVWPDSDNGDKFHIADLTDRVNLPEWVEIANDINMVEKEIDGVKVYTAVPADASTEEPITTPTAPITEEQPANNNSNLVGLIVLGAAAAVMVVGVTTIIIVNVKRRKLK